MYVGKKMRPPAKFWSKRPMGASDAPMGHTDHHRGHWASPLLSGKGIWCRVVVMTAAVFRHCRVGSAVPLYSDAYVTYVYKFYIGFNILY